MPVPPDFNIQLASVKVANGDGTFATPLDIRTYTLNPSLFIPKFYAENGADTQFALHIFDQTSFEDVVPFDPFGPHSANTLVTVDGSNEFNISPHLGSLEYRTVYKITVFSFEPNGNPIPPPDYDYAAGNPIYIRFVPDFELSKYFGPDVSYSGGTLVIRVNQLGYPVSENELDGTNITDPANIDACGLILGLLERLIAKQDDVFDHWPVEINRALLEEIPLESAASIFNDKIELKSGKILRSVKFDVKLYYRQGDNIAPL